MIVLSGVNPFDSSYFEDVAEEQGVDPVSVVQDYAVTVLLYYLNRNDLTGNLVFKGGTAIKKIYFADARFSVDLDFDLLSPTDEGAYKRFDDVIHGLVNTVMGSIEFYDVERIDTDSWLFYNIRYRVFEVDEITRVDISRDLAQGSHRQMGVISDPYIVGSFAVNVYPIEIILEQKVHALLDRNTAKDLWDIYFLHCVKDVEPVRPLRDVVDDFNRKTNNDFNKRKVIFVVNEIVSEREFMILRDMYIPDNIKADFMEVQSCVAKMIEDYW